MKTQFRFFPALLISLVLSSTLFLTPKVCAQSIKPCDSLAGAEKVIGLDFNTANQQYLSEGLKDYLAFYLELRKYPLANQVPPAVWFNPIPIGKALSSYSFAPKDKPVKKNEVKLPADLNEISFYPVGDLAELLRTRKITSLELTRFFIERLKKYNLQINCVVTFTEDLAIAQAKQADAEIAAGKYRGPLHGIPFGVKDLLSVQGYPTTWGAAPYMDQVLEETASVVEQLEKAGAVLVAKLSMGELAIDDIWFGGTTHNPWDLEQGSSGSSAGSSAAVSAGLLPFAIGSETWGSIVSPATRCGVTGLRPSYGRVSRFGAMALSWTMDKLGPICRNASDCALVFDAISIKDARDPAQFDLPFNFPPATDIKKLRIGYLKTAFEHDSINRKNSDASLEKLRKMGYELIPIEMPKDLPVKALSIILEAEAAAAFDELTRSGKVDMLARKEKGYWPDIFRRARFIPAVEYIQANRFRTELVTEMDKLFDKVDLIVSPSMDDAQSLITNLTGNPCVVVPNGLYDGKHPGSISFIGQLFDEATILAFAKAFQDVTPFDEMHPPLFSGK
ncbi:MAG TPA: amidase [Bacteroidales bacterium]